MKAVLFFLLVTLSYSVNAQHLQAKVHYRTFLDLSKQLAILNDPSTSLSRKKEVESNMKFLKELSEHSYTLQINNHESMYKLDETLSLDGNEKNSDEADDDYYKNLNEKLYIIKRDIGGRVYLVSEPLKTFDWQLHTEVKTIGKYVCHKASFSQEEERVEQIKNKDGSFERKTIKDTIITTAWYTPEISISNGPTQYGGLPGLILEISSNRPFNLNIICTEIELYPKDDVKIKRPLAKKFYTEKEYFAEIKRLAEQG